MTERLTCKANYVERHLAEPVEDVEAGRLARLRDFGTPGVAQLRKGQRQYKFIPTKIVREKARGSAFVSPVVTFIRFMYI